MKSAIVIKPYTQLTFKFSKKHFIQTYISALNIKTNKSTSPLSKSQLVFDFEEME